MRTIFKNKKHMLLITLLILLSALLVACSNDKALREEEKDIELVRTEEKVSDDYFDYIDFITKVSDERTEVLLDMADLIDNSNDDWIEEYISKSLELKEISEKIVEYGPIPSQYRKSHSYYILSAKETIQMAELVPEALYTMDSDLINQVTTHLNNASEYIGMAVDAL